MPILQIVLIILFLLGALIVHLISKKMFGNLNGPVDSGYMNFLHVAFKDNENYKTLSGMNTAHRKLQIARYLFIAAAIVVAASLMF